MFAYTAEPGLKSEQALDPSGGLVSHDGPTRAHPHHTSSLTSGSRRPASLRDRDLLVRKTGRSARSSGAAEQKTRDGTTLISATA